MEAIENTNVKNTIFDLIKKCEFEKAEALESENSISSMEISNIASKVYTELISKEKFEEAVLITEQFHLPSEKKIEAVSGQFRIFNKRKEYDKAIEWGKNYKLPDTEINNISVKAFKEALNAKEVEKALEIKNKYNIPHNMVVGLARDWFNAYIDQGKNLEALLLGQIFDISRKRTLTSGIWAYKKLLNEQDITKFMALEQKYYILTDRDLDQIDRKEWDNFAKVFINAVIKVMISSNRIDQLAQIVESIKILVYRDNSPYMSALISQIADVVTDEHKHLMESAKYSDAFKLIESFHLLSENISSDAKSSVIEHAEEAHNELLDENNLEGAKVVKDNYDLFGKNIITKSMNSLTAASMEYLERALDENNIENAKSVIKEYNINKNAVLLKTNKVLTSKLKSRKFVEVFEIMKEIKTGSFTSELLTEATTSFQESYESGQIELACNLAHHFKIKNTRAVKAFFMLWNKHIEAGRYEIALDLKKKYKIPRKKLEPVVKELYSTLMASSQTEDAAAIRRDYNINLSFWNMITEMLKSIFGKK